MHEGRRHIVLQLNYGESQRRDGQNLGAMDGPVPLKFSSLCHAELVGKMPPLVMVLREKNKPFYIRLAATIMMGDSFNYRKRLALHFFL